MIPIWVNLHIAILDVFPWRCLFSLIFLVFFPVMVLFIIYAPLVLKFLSGLGPCILTVPWNTYWPYRSSYVTTMLGSVLVIMFFGPNNKGRFSCCQTFSLIPYSLHWMVRYWARCTISIVGAGLVCYRKRQLGSDIHTQWRTSMWIHAPTWFLVLFFACMGSFLATFLFVV